MTVETVLAHLMKMRELLVDEINQLERKPEEYLRQRRHILDEQLQQATATYQSIQRAVDKGLLKEEQ